MIHLISTQCRYVHRIQHGDWFGGKGVGLCQILINGYTVNIYIAHVRIVRLTFLLIGCDIDRFENKFVCISL